MGEFGSLAEYKAYVDAKYRGDLPEQKLARAQESTRRRKDRWLLIDPHETIVGVLASHCASSATEAFEEFYPSKRERREVAALGYHIERDDEKGTRFDSWAQQSAADGATADSRQKGSE